MKGVIALKKAVFFDLFETLITEYDEDRNSKKTPESQLGIERRKFKNEMKIRRNDRMTGKYKNYKEVLIDICLACNKEVDEQLIERIYQQRVQRKEKWFKQIDKDILSQLSGLREKGLMLGIISNCTEEEVRGWKYSALAPYFDTVLFSYREGICKPQKEIYLLACNELKIPPQDCIFIGDGGSNELEGAKSVGMKPYQATWFTDRFIKPYAPRINSIEVLSEIKQIGEIQS